MRVNVIFEMAKDGGCSCYMVEELPHFALMGYGDNPHEAKADMMEAYEEIKEMLKEEGKDVPELEFEYHYDMKSFFEYFDFLNISKVAELAGINPALMRRYATGASKAGETQYLKLQNAVQGIAKELAAAHF